MCGIAGFCGNGSFQNLETMTNALSHRGPDGQGFLFDEDKRVGLGHRRLTIVDIEGGTQPMWNHDGRVCVVYNGEIYNSVELRKTLIELGYQFLSSHSDTEVLVNGYLAWGEDLPSRLNGMFAFAIFDPKNNNLFLSRDRFGEKPLFFTRTKNSFVFASELTSLMLHREVENNFSALNLQKYFAYGYLPGPNTLFEGVFKLPGGCSMTVDIGANSYIQKRYWQFEFRETSVGTNLSSAKLEDELDSLLGAAVKRRFMSDVPVGIFLSGGLDSSVVLAKAAEFIDPVNLNTFTIGFDVDSFDESKYALQVAQQFGTNHHTKMFDFEQCMELIPSVLGKLDDSICDPSILPTYMLSQLVTQTVKVALSGDGGDELFAGYDTFAALKYAQVYRKMVPDMVHNFVSSISQRLPKSSKNMSFDFKLNRALSAMPYPPKVMLPIWMSPLDTKGMEHFFETPFDQRDVYSEAIELWEGTKAKNDTERALDFYTNLYLQDNILVKSDRASMMNSLESRAVFLDNEIVDFCERLPVEYKFDGIKRKILLRKVAERYLPSKITSRKKKGFGIPVSQWLKRMTIPMKPIKGTRIDFVHTAIAEHQSGQKDHRLFLWAWLTLQYQRNMFSELSSHGV